MLSKIKKMDNKVVVNVKKLHRNKLNKFMVIITKIRKGDNYGKLHKKFWI